MTRRISVALATYNGAEHLADQLASIRQQSLPVDEIVVSDDASTDGTVEVVREEMRKLPGVDWVVLENPDNAGFVRNFDRALRATTGDVVLLSDQDDLWLPNRVADSVAGLGPRETLVFGDALVDEEPMSTMWDRLELDERARRRLERDPFAFLMRGNVVMGATIALTRDLLEVVLPMPDVAFHDYWIACVAAACGTVRTLPSPVLEYRQHEHNASGGAPAAGQVSRARGRLAQAGYADRREHLQALAVRLRGRADTYAEMAARGAAFLSMRDELPERRVRRVGPVVRHMVHGDYHRYSRGVANAAFDLVRSR